MALNREEILVLVKNKVLGAEELAKEGKLIREVKNETGELTRVFEKQTSTERQRLTVKEKTLDNGKKQVTTNKEVLAQGPPFQAHFLGLMFGGMALNRAMSNLTSTSKEWVGAAEIMSTTMGVVMLPATMELLNTAILPLSDALLGLPDDVKLSVGITALGLEGLGKLAEVVGQIALFKIAFPQATAKIIAMTASVVSLNGAVAVLGIAISALAFNAWINNLAEYQRAWDKVGESVETTTQSLGQLGQMTRTAVPEFTAGAIDLAKPTIGQEGSALFSAPIATRDVTAGFTFDPGLFPTSNTVGTGGVSNTQGGSISITNNISVADKREFERMINKNNQSIVNEIRRNVNV